MKREGGEACARANSMPVKRLGNRMSAGEKEGEKEMPEFLLLVQDGSAGVYCLHAQDLVVALLIVEHGRRKVVKHILRREGSMCLDPLVPDEEPVRVIVARVEIFVVHTVRLSEPEQRK